MLSKKLMSQVGQLRRMNTAQITSWALAVYREGFIDGLREGETEFDDALILQEEEAAEYFGRDAVDRAVMDSDKKREMDEASDHGDMHIEY